MAFKTVLNFYTGELQLVDGNSGGDVVGPSSADDNAIARFDGTTGKLIQNSKTILQDGGAIEAQAFITRTKITDDVLVRTDEAWIAPALELTLTGSVILEPDSELIIE